ncbi:MAG: DMT family transporter [Planctomycetota bacterium]
MKSQTVAKLSLLGFAFLSAGRDLSAAFLFARSDWKIEPVAFTWLLCVASIFTFYAIACIRTKSFYLFHDFKECTPRTRSRLLLLNVMTLVAYLTTFLAIQKVDAYINAIIDYGASPVVTAALAVLMRAERLSGRAIGGMFMSVCGIGVLTLWLTAPGPNHPTSELLMGVGYAFISCVAASLNNVWNKEVVDAGLRRERVLLLRLPLAVAGLGAWVVLGPYIWGGASSTHLASEHMWQVITVLAIGAVGMAGPLLLIVFALETLEVKNLAFSMFLVPVFTYAGMATWKGVQLGPLVAGIVVVLGVLMAESVAGKNGFSRSDEESELDHGAAN